MSSYNEHAVPKDFTIGQRVETHPATSAWMMGDRYGEVVKVGRKFVHVSMDRSGRTLRWSPRNLGSLS